MIFYTDGSYNRKKYPEVYGWAFVVVNDNTINTHEEGVGQDFIESHQIGGECQAIIEVLKYCQKHHIFDIEIYHDYIGVAHWALGSWKANKDVSKRYKLDYIIQKSALEDIARASGSKVKIAFKHIKGHSGNIFNDHADKYANLAIEKYYQS